MPKFSITAATIGLLCLALSLFAQQPGVEPEPIPRAIPKAIPGSSPGSPPSVADPIPAETPADASGAEAGVSEEPTPIDHDELDGSSIPRAVPTEQDIPRAQPLSAQEIERLRTVREARRIMEEDERRRILEEEARMRAIRDREIAERNGQPVLDEDGNEVTNTAGVPGEGEMAIPRAIPRAVPRAIPVAKPEGGETAPPEAPEREPLSPMEVASRKAPDAPVREPERPVSKVTSSWDTRTDARSLTMHIPAPRGLIVDRWGQPLAQNRVANVLAIKLPHLDDTPPREVLSYARTRVARANSVLGQDWQVSDQEILSHFEHRRWLPLMFSTPLTQVQEQSITPQLDKGLVLFPTYVRHYPENKLAAHIIGSTRKVRKMPTGPVVSGEELFPLIAGRDGLEISFDANLTGTPGVVDYLFDSDGTQLNREISKPAVPGSTVVTTLDLEMQELAEKILESSVKRGAFVVMNVHTGEILTMASYPAFDPNEFSPSISQTRFDELLNDPDQPLIARAFRGTYPPASTFKIVTALAALESGVITEQTLLPCPTVMIIDKRPFHNWNKKGEGDMNVVTAIARSCNPFFYRAGMRAGAESLSSMGFRLGFGRKTGIELAGEQAGYMPTDSSLREKFNYGLAGGHLANTSIGQGTLAATPLQVCQMMAAVANGRAVPQARLVKQIQNYNNRVTRNFPAQDRNLINVDQSALDTVRRGLKNVVNSSWGTGKSAGNDYVTMTGKTGTGQWGKPSDKRYVAWFAGYVPFENPEYAFAVLYEGDPGEKVGGGRIAAPLAGRFFNAVYKKKKEGGELEDYQRSVPDTVAPSTYVASETTQPAPRVEPAPPREEPKAKRRGFFSRFGRRGR